MLPTPRRLLDADRAGCEGMTVVMAVTTTLFLDPRSGGHAAPRERRGRGGAAGPRACAVMLPRGAAVAQAIGAQVGSTRSVRIYCPGQSRGGA